MNDTTRLFPLHLLNQDSLDFSTYCLSSFGSGYLKFSLVLSFFILSVRETGSHRETSAVPLRGILGAVLVMLLILGGGLYLWKIHEKMKTGRGRLPFSFQAHIPLFLHWILDILSPTKCPCRGVSGCGHGLCP